MEPDRRTDQRAREVIGAAIEVHRSLGPGFSESVYEEALVVELGAREIPFARQVSVEVSFRGRRVGGGRIDLLIDSCLVVEIKAVDALAPVHTAQVISYLKSKQLVLGLLINFNVAVLRDGIRRVILSDHRPLRRDPTIT